MDREQSPLEKTSHRTVLCRSCGAEYPADSASCPYCGTMNLPAAETEYLDRLEGIRDNLEELGSLTDRKAKSHLRKLQRNLLIGAVILALLITTAVIVRTNSEKAEAEKEKNDHSQLSVIRKGKCRSEPNQEDTPASFFQFSEMDL